MDTWFASAERANEKLLREQIAFIENNPVFKAVLDSLGGLLAVLNEDRQVLAVNQQMLQSLNLHETDDFAGLRPGELLDCVYSDLEAGGCGTSKYCSTCGAAIAIVTTLKSNKPSEKLCALKSRKGDKIEERALLVRCSPFYLYGKKLLLLFLQDITEQEQRFALESIFFHDIANMLNGLLGATELMESGISQPELFSIVKHNTLRLIQEVHIQRMLLSSDPSNFSPYLKPVSIRELLQETEDLFLNHWLVKGHDLKIAKPDNEYIIHTDSSIVIRILSNMISNALEAGSDGDIVKVSHKIEKESVRLTVWNRQHIPEDIARRIFQRSFSTKGGSGRGLGTYSMKLLAENFLGGHVSFESSREAGTSFHLILPCVAKSD
jgi:hypothetical protein